MIRFTTVILAFFLSTQASAWVIPRSRVKAPRTDVAFSRPSHPSAKTLVTNKLRATLETEPETSFLTPTWEQDRDRRLKELQDHIDKNPKFKQNLEQSILKAYTNAKMYLNPDLFQAFLQECGTAWPTSIVQYMDYLKWYASYTPHQSSYKGWLADPSDPDSGTQEVYDQLCHFYFLVDQELSDGRIVQDDEWFAKWLDEYAIVWGEFCDTTESISPATIYSFYERSPKYDMLDSMIPWNKENIPVNNVYPKFTIFKDGVPMRSNSPSGWLTWNQMFARELNPGLRPIASPTDNTVICSPADCHYRAIYPINENSELPKEITIKQTHKYASITELLEGSIYANSFAGGTFVHYFLGPYSYHRFHTPVAGMIKECYPVQGLAYLAVDINKETQQFDAPDNSNDGYEFTQARGIITIDTSGSPYGDVGVVAVVPIGMAQVSAVSMMATAGVNVEKGTEFGYFLFGGSDIILLFQKGVDPKMMTNSDIYNLVGTNIGTVKRLGR